jgi:hypothetical protein
MNNNLFQFFTFDKIQNAMFKKLLLFIFFCSTSLVAVSQSKQKKLNGFVKDFLGVIKDANVLNLSTGKGAFSLDDGTFQIKASEGDSLQISSVRHFTKTIVVSKENINNKSIEITLRIKVIVLDEINLNPNNLSGFLGYDANHVPTKVRDSLLKESMKYLTDATKDYIKPKVIKTEASTPKKGVDPTQNRLGDASLSINLPSPSLKKERDRKAHLEYLNKFPEILLTDFGDDFFFVQLEIPKDRYYHFLEYCNPLGIENLYKEGKKLEVLKILEKEHVGYLKIIAKE